MSENNQKVKVAVIQASPILFDREATVEKVCRLTEEAAAQGAKLILFPEAFIPAYPRGLTFGTVVGRRSSEGRRIFQRYWDNSIDVPGPDTPAKAPSSAPCFILVPMVSFWACIASSNPPVASVSSGVKETAAR
jgi:nitrilase